MPNTSKCTFSLPEEQSTYIDQMVASGAFASASEVVRAGLRALQEREAAVDRRLWEAVGPVYDAMQADLGRGVPTSQIFDELRYRHTEHRSKGT